MLDYSCACALPVKIGARTIIVAVIAAIVTSISAEIAHWQPRH
jgi:hypothetical protein